MPMPSRGTPSWGGTKSPFAAEARESLLGDYSDHEEGDGAGGGGDQLRRAQEQVDDVVGIMRDNIGKVLDRGDKLGDLEDKSENLMEGAQAFRRGAKKLSWNTWCQSLRSYFIVGGIVALILTVVIAKAVLKKKAENSLLSPTTTTSPQYI